MSDRFAERLRDVLERAARVCGDDREDAAIRLARRLGIGGFFRSRFPGNFSDGSVDGERTLRVLAEGFIKEAAEELSAVLKTRGVQHFFFKGVAVADKIYAPGEREMADIDVHVVPSAREVLSDTLLELGYEIPPDEQQEGPAALRAGIVAFRSNATSEIEHIEVDVAWGLDPVDRLLPRPDRPVPKEIWDRLDLTGSLPVPCDAHHVVLLVHHMVHHDMLHIRGLVDLALLWPGVDPESADEIEALAKQLGVLRASRLVSAVLQSDLGVTLASARPAPVDSRGRRARRMLDPVNWCVWASNAADNEFVEINARRIRRRILLLDDLLATPGLVADAVFPPREYLRWRWPDARSTAEALVRHMARVVGKLA